MSKIIESITMVLGYLVLVYIVVISVCYLIYHVRRIINKQTKIKCLCKHEYAIDFVWETRTGDSTLYVLECRKCRKRKEIRIYKGKIFKSDLIKEHEMDKFKEEGGIE